MPAVTLAYYIAALIALTIFLVLVFQPTLRSESQSTRDSSAAFVASLCALFFAFRWPVFLSGVELNPDEGQFIANALKATRDVWPWHGFDGTTSGPLNSDVLLMPALVGFHIDFFSSRVIGGLLVVGTLIAFYVAMRNLFGDRVARLAVVPPALFFAVTHDADFIHYSSEHLPVFLTTLALASGSFLLRHDLTPPQRILACVVGGISIGSTAFAKLQALPLAVVLLAYIVVAIALAHATWADRWKEGLALLASLGLPVVVILGAVVATGEWRDFMISYVTWASVYMHENHHMPTGFLVRSSRVYTALLGLFVLLTAVGALALAGRRLRWKPATLVAAVSSLALLCAAFFAILAPLRGYSHYLLFSVIPIAWCIATLLALTRDANLWKAREIPLTAGFLAVFVLAEFGATFSKPNPFVDQLPANMSFRQGPVAAVIARYASRGTPMAIWGWMPEYYVQTGTIMATRDAETEHQINGGPFHNYFRQRFLSDLTRTAPPVFVDAIAPPAFAFHDRAQAGLQTFPELLAYVRSHYTLREEVNGVRIFVAKNDHISARAVVPERR